MKPVLIEFHEAKERNDLYAACKEGLKKTGLVMTEDSRSQRILANFMKSQVTSGHLRKEVNQSCVLHYETFILNRPFVLSK